MRKIFIIMIALLIALPIGLSYAQSKYSIKEMTPEVKVSLEARRDRYEILSGFKHKGMIGENNKGYVEAFSETEEVIVIVNAENDDRKVIYKTIAEQNGLVGALAIIEKVFAETQRDNSEQGEKIQLEDGTWTTK